MSRSAAWCSIAASSSSISPSRRSPGSASSSPIFSAGSPMAGRCRRARWRRRCVAAAFLIWTEKHLAALQEAIIGVVFVVAASAEIILFGFNPHGAENLKDLLVGQILWVDAGAAHPGGHALCRRACDLCLRRSDAAARAVLRRLRRHGDRIGAARRRIPGLRLADRAGAGGRASPARDAPCSSAMRSASSATSSALLCSAFLDFPTGAAIVCALALMLAGTIVAAAFRGRLAAGQSSHPPV